MKKSNHGCTFESVSNTGYVFKNPFVHFYLQTLFFPSLEQINMGTNFIRILPKWKKIIKTTEKKTEYLRHIT